MIVYICPFRNAAQYIDECVESLLIQKETDWRAIFLDDNSDDGTSDMIPVDPRFTIIKNSERLSALPSIVNAIISSNIQPEDIIAFLDGDDKLIGDDVNEIILSMYEDETLLTYGQYIINGIVGHCSAYNRYEFSQLRRIGFRASHLRTFKYKLYQDYINIDPSLYYLKDGDGKFYTTCYDVAIMTPLMEIAGFDRVKFNPEQVYYYRRHSLNEDVVMHDLQYSISREILRKHPINQQSN